MFKPELDRAYSGPEGALIAFHSFEKVPGRVHLTYSIPGSGVLEMEGHEEVHELMEGLQLIADTEDEVTAIKSNRASMQRCVDHLDRCIGFVEKYSKTEPGQIISGGQVAHAVANLPSPKPRAIRHIRVQKA
jgi:hypothetical protein